MSPTARCRISCEGKAGDDAGQLLFSREVALLNIWEKGHLSGNGRVAFVWLWCFGHLC